MVSVVVMAIVVGVAMILAVMVPGVVMLALMGVVAMVMVVVMPLTVVVMGLMMRCRVGAVVAGAVVGMGVSELAMMGARAMASATTTTMPPAARMASTMMPSPAMSAAGQQRTSRAGPPKHGADGECASNLKSHDDALFVVWRRPITSEAFSDRASSEMPPRRGERPHPHP